MLKNIKTERLQEIADYVENNGYILTKEKYGISDDTIKRYKRELMKREVKINKTTDMNTDENIKKILEAYYITGYAENIETVKRYIRSAKKRFPEWVDFMESTMSIRKNYTTQEIKQIARGERKPPTRTKEIGFTGEKFVFAHITDSHMGSIFFKEYVWDAMCKEIERRDVDRVFHTGDVVEGLNSKRIDMIYECTHIGYDKQKEYAVQMLNKIQAPIEAVDGNHDRWFKKSAGACIVKDIANEVDHMSYLGEDMADVLINDVVIRLWHGEDGSSYATSYRLQKLIEAFTGGDKPNILLAGHTHKMCNIFDRNVHCLSGGAISTQSTFMKRTKKANHTGFYIVEVVMNERGVVQFTPTFYPFYE